MTITYDTGQKKGESIVVKYEKNLSIQGYEKNRCRVPMTLLGMKVLKNKWDVYSAHKLVGKLACQIKHSCIKWFSTSWCSWLHKWLVHLMLYCVHQLEITVIPTKVIFRRKGTCYTAYTSTYKIFNFVWWNCILASNPKRYLFICLLLFLSFALMYAMLLCFIYHAFFIKIFIILFF